MLGDAELLVHDVEEESNEHFHDDLEQLDDVEDYDGACDVADDVHDDVEDWELHDVLLDKSFDDVEGLKELDGHFRDVEELDEQSDYVVAAVLDSGGNLVDIEAHDAEELNELLLNAVEPHDVLRHIRDAPHDYLDNGGVLHDVSQHEAAQLDEVQHDVDQHGVALHIVALLLLA